MDRYFIDDMKEISEKEYNNINDMNDYYMFQFESTKDFSFLQRVKFIVVVHAN